MIIFDKMIRKEEYVHSMANFAATVKGQVSVSRNEPLFLLDDSHGFWWLVRSSYSNEVGYIPSEFVETKLEREARLNAVKNQKVAFKSTDIVVKKSDKRVKICDAANKHFYMHPQFLKVKILSKKCENAMYKTVLVKDETRVKDLIQDVLNRYKIEYSQDWSLSLCTEFEEIQMDEDDFVSPKINHDVIHAMMQRKPKNFAKIHIRLQNEEIIKTIQVPKSFTVEELIRISVCKFQSAGLSTKRPEDYSVVILAKRDYLLVPNENVVSASSWIHFE